MWLYYKIKKEVELFTTYLAFCVRVTCLDYGAGFAVSKVNIFILMLI